MVLKFILNLFITSCWLLLIYFLDKHRKYKGNYGIYLLVFIIGFLSSFVADLLYEAIESIMPFDRESERYFIANFLIVGPVEEFSKFIIFFITIRSTKFLCERIDGILLSATIGLSFGILENVSYANIDGFHKLIDRSIIPILLHMCFSVIWGLALTNYLIKKKTEYIDAKKWKVFIALLISIILHANHNFTIDIERAEITWIQFFILLFVIFVIVLRNRTVSPYKNFTLQEYQTAIPIVKKGLLLSPKNFYLNKKLALLYLYKGDYDKAYKFLKKCKGINSDDKMTLRLLEISKILTGEQYSITNKGMKTIIQKEYAYLIKKYIRNKKDKLLLEKYI